VTETFLLHASSVLTTLETAERCVNRRRTGSGWSSMVQWMQSGLRTWTRCSMTTRSYASWVERLFSCRRRQTWSLNQWTLKLLRQPPYGTICPCCPLPLPFLSWMFFFNFMRLITTSYFTAVIDDMSLVTCIEHSS